MRPTAGTSGSHDVLQEGLAEDRHLGRPLAFLPRLRRGARKLSVPSIIPAVRRLPTAETWCAAGFAAIREPMVTLGDALSARPSARPAFHEARGQRTSRNQDLSTLNLLVCETSSRRDLCTPQVRLAAHRQREARPLRSRRAGMPTTTRVLPVARDLSPGDRWGGQSPTVERAPD